VLLLVLNARSVGILIRLVRSHSFVSTEEFGRELRISRATIGNDVKTINKWLQEHNLDTIRYRRCAGYYFEDAAKISVEEKLGELSLDRQYKNTREERIAWIGVILLIRENCIFNKHLTEKFSLSRSTIQRDLKLLAVTLILGFCSHSTKHMATPFPGMNRISARCSFISWPNSILTKKLTGFNLIHIRTMSGAGI
jgi:transcriptional antiterminator